MLPKPRLIQKWICFVCTYWANNLIDIRSFFFHRYHISQNLFVEFEVHVLSTQTSCKSDCFLSSHLINSDSFILTLFISFVIWKKLISTFLGLRLLVLFLAIIITCFTFTQANHTYNWCASLHDSGWYRFVPYSFKKYNMRTSFNLSRIHGRNVLMYVHVTHSVWWTSISEDTLYTYAPWNHLLTHFTFCILWCNTTPLPINISHHLNLVSDVR